MKLVKDAYKRVCVLGTEVEAPTQVWTQKQKKTVAKNAKWFRAFPLTGGAVNIQEGTFEVVGEMTNEEIKTHFTTQGFNPAAECVLKMIAA